MTDGHLLAATEAALAARPQSRVVPVSHAGRQYIAKRLAEKPRRLLQTLFMRWLVKRLTGQPLPLRTLALSEAAYSISYEANRLKALATAGVAVPKLVLHTEHYILLQNCGRAVAALLETWPPETWRSELPRLAAELGSFHAAGHWHGGAQIKNITCHEGRFTRIDFEENFGEFLPLLVCQANDLIIFMNSISLAGPIDEAETRRLLPELLTAYAANNPAPELRDFLKQSLPCFRRIATLARPFRRFSRKGIRRIEILVDILDSELAPP